MGVSQCHKPWAFACGIVQPRRTRESATSLTDGLVFFPPSTRSLHPFLSSDSLDCSKESFHFTQIASQGALLLALSKFFPFPLLGSPDLNPPVASRYAHREWSSAIGCFFLVSNRICLDSVSRHRFCRFRLLVDLLELWKIHPTVSQIGFSLREVRRSV